MCLFPRYIKNKRYSSYKIKKSDIPCPDPRKLYVPIGCGKCYECKRQKAQQWRVRLMEEIKVQKYPKFITLTFSNDALNEMCKRNNTNENNAVATTAVRMFLERYRKHNGKSLRHWLITEMGHEGTERIHLHGIIFPPKDMTNEELANYWKYGRTDIGEYCNERTINYIIKYVTKVDIDHKHFEPVILCSAGLGENFIHTAGAQKTYKYKHMETPEYYTLNDGNKVALPIYYRNKLYTQKERDKMWTDRLDKEEIYVNGIRIRNITSAESQRYYFKLIEEQQKWNNSIGYGNTSEEWKTKPYNVTFKELQRQTKERKNSDINKEK